ncbi:hypothetical protein [Dyella mobilis]|uniref:Uncharacterized protein n=1 Tax=Dyella mobilis TaxID=1849582 RepID=A0ABS2KDW8_9GAMM|nr:hypothetical protein [Dyella mobilis]MBM7129367.1 hypothetical protein [Dyella mobilis]
MAAQVVSRWRENRAGLPLVSVPFPDAQEAQCHANAERYVALHGGEVVRGWLIQHPDSWPQVYVRTHSVVRRLDGSASLVDPTLAARDLRGQAFFDHVGDAEVFDAIKLAYAELLLPLPD